jgi:hypothetical protein
MRKNGTGGPQKLWEAPNFGSLTPMSPNTVLGF